MSEHPIRISVNFNFDDENAVPDIYADAEPGNGGAFLVDKDCQLVAADDWSKTVPLYDEFVNWCVCRGGFSEDLAKDVAEWLRDAADCLESEQAIVVNNRINYKPANPDKP